VAIATESEAVTPGLPNVLSAVDEAANRITVSKEDDETQD
jgi:hypothetical protein